MAHRRSFAVLGALAAALAPVRAPATAPVTVVTVVAYQYLPGDSDPASHLEVERGAQLYLANLDALGAHNLVAIEVIDEQPLFESDPVNTGAATEVRGVPHLGPGTYDFMCTVHGYDAMHGSLQVV